MDPETVKIAAEVLKHGPDVVKTVSAVVGSVKFTEFTKAMLGPAANEVAKRIHDEFRLYRFGRQLEMLKKAEKMAKDAGFTPKAVPIKLLFPLLEGASLEENETLHDMWAALLANAASPENARKITVTYPGGANTPGQNVIVKVVYPYDAWITYFPIHPRLGSISQGVIAF